MNEVARNIKKQEVLAMFQQNQSMAQLQQTDEEAFSIEFEAEVARRIAQKVQELVAMEQQFQSQQNQDPLLALKTRELDLRAMDIQRKHRKKQQKWSLKLINSLHNRL